MKKAISVAISSLLGLGLAFLFVKGILEHAFEGTPVKSWEVALVIMAGPAILALLVACIVVGLRVFSQELKLQFMMTLPITSVYQFSLELTDQLWNVLGLTPEEKAIADTSGRPGGFTLEQWGRFNRWRVSQAGGGQAQEWTFNQYNGWRGWPNHWRHITLWELKLPEGYVKLEWREGVVRLFAYGGRFGGKIGLEGWEPAIEYAFFSLPLPFTLPAQYAMPELERKFHEDLGRYLMPTERPRPSWDDDLAYTRMPGRDLYQCDEREGKGFLWILERYDLRPIFPAYVTKIHQKRRDSRVRGITLQLLDIGLKVWANPSVIDPDEDGQTILCNAEAVRLVLDKSGKVERIWPYGNNYGEVAHFPVLRCPQCGQKDYSLSGVWENEKRKKLCQQCSKKWGEEHKR
jgi:hypothetical protein